MNFRIRPQTFLVARDQEKFFFSSFGQRILIETSDGPLLQKIWSDLEQQSPNIFSSFTAASENAEKNTVQLLGHLERQGLIENHDEVAFPEAPSNHPWLPLIRYYYSSLRAQLGALEKLMAFTLEIDLPKDPSLASFGKKFGLQIKPDASFSLFVAHHWEAHRLQVFAQKMLAQKKSWLPVVLTPHGARMGPLLGPHWKICWNCVTQRRLSHVENLQYTSPFENYSGTGPQDSQLLPSHVAMIEHFAQNEIFKSVIENNSRPNRLLDIDLITPSITSHIIWPDSSCECFYVWD
ncbi:MAG: TOMM precursor leader peptide-binding protein [Bdellovibrio sp.]|nr:TOMM precursor leader peptide-binding protein [Bdellovibrio sp.]